MTWFRRSSAGPVPEYSIGVLKRSRNFRPVVFVEPWRYAALFAFLRGTPLSAGYGQHRSACHRKLGAKATAMEAMRRAQSKPLAQLDLFGSRKGAGAPRMLSGMRPNHMQHST